MDSNFLGLDSLLSEVGISPEQLAGYGPLRELNMKEPHVIVPSLSSSRARKHHLKVKEKLHDRQHSRKPQGEQQSQVNKDFSQTKDSKHSDFFSAEVLEDLASFGVDQIIFAKGEQWPPPGPGFLDLYSGRKGFARSAVKLGAKWVLTVDYNDGPQCDLLDRKVRERIWRLVEHDVFLHISAAPICASFSIAITPQVRSPEQPRGIEPIRPGMIQKIADGNSHSQFLSKLIRRAIHKGIAYWVENPDSSYLWRQPEWVQLPFGMRKKFWRVDFCSFGTPWRKRTRFIISGRLGNTKRLCTCKKRHVILRGRSKKHRMSMTKLAEPYPTGLCYMLAWAACSDVGILRANQSLVLQS